MKSLSSLLIASAVIATASAASADVIAGWSIPTAVTATTAATYSYGAANLGAQVSGSMLSGTHSSALTAWSSPAGNGSTYALSSNGWTTGDYYQVSMATTGYSDISVSWDQTRSGTGPSAFSLTMSTDGGANFTTLLASYTVLQAGGTGTGTTGWSAAGLYQTGFTTTTIVGISAANQGNILLRFNSLSTPAVGGTNRVDNISVTGALVAVPSPGAIALIGLAGLVARRRR